MSCQVNEQILEKIFEDVLKMDILDVAQELNISKKAFFEIPDLEDLRNQLTEKRFEALC